MAHVSSSAIQRGGQSLAALLTLLLAFALVPADAAAQSTMIAENQLAPRGRACVGGEGVTVIVDLTFFDQGVVTGCAQGDPVDSVEALQTADFEIEVQSFDFGDLICAIEGLPTLACDEPFAGNFWGYFNGDVTDGSWTSSTVGASANDPVPGDIDGWRYGTGADEAPTVPATGATPTGQACAADEGVTVVVDLTIFDAGILTSCAAGDPVDGLDALALANFEIITQDSDFGTFVCAIQGQPELACDEPFAGSFWAYFEGTEDGSWISHEVGASDTDPAPGDIEGWRYGAGEGPGESTDPSVDTSTDTDSSTDTPTDTPADTVRRLAGGDRIETAIAISQDRFDDGTAGAVVLGRADVYADALPGTPLAVAVDGPILINPSSALDDRVVEEISRVLPTGGTIHLLGGVLAIDTDVETALAAMGYDVVRAGGQDRIETAIQVAQTIGQPTNLLITTGYDFPDALSAGAAAAATGDGAVLLTGDGTPHPAVNAYLDSRTDTAVFAIGGPASRAYPGATSVMGDDREATAVAVAQTFFTAPFGDAPAVIGVGQSQEFADALAGGYHIATLGGPLLITPGNMLSPAVSEYVCATDSADDAVVYGGEAAITQAVVDALAADLEGSACS